MRRAITIATIVLMSLATGVASASGAGLEASLSRYDVGLGESFELRLTATGAGSEAPDLSPLEQDFVVLGASRLDRSVIVNGRLDRSREWIVELSPRRSGPLEIPAIGFVGGSGPRTAPIGIDVATAAARTAPSRPAPGGSMDTPAVFVDAEVDDEQPYVQGQLMLRVRIYSDGSLLSGRLAEPRVPGATVEQVGEDDSYQTSIDGRSYQVIERAFAISPQRSGRLTIPPIAFEGKVPAAASRGGRGAGRFGSHQAFGRSLLDDFDAMLGQGFFGPSGLDDFFGPRGQLVRAETAALSVDVQERPAEATGRWWLPATGVELSEEWDEAPDRIHVGEQLTRSLMIRADGASGDQLPELELPDVPGVKQYREPAVDQTVQTRDGLASVKLQKTVLIPTQPGEVVLPAVELEWWDTRADRARVASLPERRIQVLGDGGALAAATPQPGPEVSSSDAGADGPIATGPAEGQGGASGDLAAKAGPPWLWALVVAIGTVVVAALLGRSLRRGRAPEAPVVPSRGPGDPAVRGASKRSERELEAACRKGDPAAAARALSTLAVSLSSGHAAASPGALAEQLGDEAFIAAVADLNRARFATADANAWSGAGLWQAYREARRRSASARKGGRREVLPGLYPEAST